MRYTAASCLAGIAALLCGVTGTTLAAPVALSPLMAGQYAAGAGVDADFLKVPDLWKHSTVLWNEGTKTYGTGVPVSTFDWGTGLWGIADWKTVNQVGPIEGSLHRRVGSISFGDAEYNSQWGATWGNVALAPLFTDAQQSRQSQDNWTSHFFGYIRISEAGAYNFSVLHDDGFFFKLGGASGKTLELIDDYLNPRERLGFASNVLLDVGLYSFDLGSYDRIGAGVVDLSWARGGGDWSLVPTDHLVALGDAVAVPEPGSLGLVVAGLLVAGALLVRRRPMLSRPRRNGRSA